MRFINRAFAGLLWLALAAGLLAWAAVMLLQAIEDRRADVPRPPGARERVLPARVVRITPVTLRPRLELVGEVVAARAVDLRSGAAGTVSALHPAFVEGGEVSAGARPVELDASDAEAAHALAKADLADAEAELAAAEEAVRLAESDLAAAERVAALRRAAEARSRALAERGAVTDAALEAATLARLQADQAVIQRRQALASARNRLARARVALERRRVQLEEARRRLEDFVVVAPFAGRLTEVAPLQLGGRVGAGERLARLIDPARLEVAFTVSRSAFARLIDAEGRLRPLPVELRLELAERQVLARGRLARAGAALGAGQSGRRLYAALEGPAPLVPGDLVTLEVEEPPLEGVAELPARAIGADGTVLALAAGERLEALPVRVLRRHGDRAVIDARPLAGREVVAVRSPLLGAGLKVRPLREGGAEAPAPGAGQGETGTVRLDPERRKRLMEAVRASRLPAEARERILRRLEAPEVPAGLVRRIERRIGG